MPTINEVATIENAKAYQATSEKFIFCIDLLEISAHRSNADALVNALEDRFDDLLAETIIQSSVVSETFGFQLITDAKGGKFIRATNGPTVVQFRVLNAGMALDTDGSNVNRHYQHLPAVALAAARWWRHNRQEG